MDSSGRMILTLDNALDFRFPLEKFWNHEEERVQFVVTAEVTIQLSNGDIITAPKGMITDFRSAPVPALEKTKWGYAKAVAGKKIVEAVCPQIGRHSSAVFVHDTIYILYKHKYTRQWTDEEMTRWNIACQVPRWQYKLMYLGVDLAGQKWWDN